MFKSSISKQKSESSKNQDLSHDEIKHDGKIIDSENTKTNNLHKLQNNADSSSKVNSLNTIQLKESKSNNSVIQREVNLGDDERKRLAAIHGINKNVKNAASGIDESVNHGDASMTEKAKNVAKNTISDGTSKGKSFFSRAKEKAGKAWGGAKSFFGSLFKGKDKKEKKEDDRSFKDKAKSAGAAGVNVLKGAGVGAVSEVAKGTVGKAADVGIEAKNAAKSGYDAYEAHNIAKGRGKEDLLGATARDVRNTHAKQGLSSAANATAKGVSIAESVGTFGLKDVAKSAAKGAVKGGVAAAMGPGEQAAIQDRSDLSLGETLAGKSKSEEIHEEDYKKIVDMPTSNVARKRMNYEGGIELSEEQKKAASKSRSALFQEAFDRSAGHKSNTEANALTNTANSLGTSSLSDKMSLKDQAEGKRIEAQDQRQGINEGTTVIKPSNIKAYRQDMEFTKDIGDRLKADDSENTEKLIANEQKTHERTPLASTLIDQKRDEIIGKNKSRDQIAKEEVKQKAGTRKFKTRKAK